MNRSLPLEPLSLTGRRVRLDPLVPGHLEALTPVAADPSLWEWTLVRLSGRDGVREYVAEALREHDSGKALPFVTVALPEGTVVGSTRFGGYEPSHCRVEIGWTWLAASHRGRGLNTEAKYLMLRHAFERLGCRRVEFKTDVNNARSRAALSKIGAREEGVLRHHMQNWTGRFRDTVYYSIIAPEWPAVREHLERLLEDE